MHIDHTALAVANSTVWRKKMPLLVVVVDLSHHEWICDMRDGSINKPLVSAKQKEVAASVMAMFSHPHYIAMHAMEMLVSELEMTVIAYSRQLLSSPFCRCIFSFSAAVSCGCCSIIDNAILLAGWLARMLIWSR